MEFGCSGGRRLGHTYKQKNTDTVWHGVDIFQPALNHAKDMIDSSWKMDANKLKPNKTMLKTPYDALVYGDVIDHLIQPDNSLPDHFKLLKKGGKVIICIPNIQHWTVMKHALDGNWEYQDQGILDRAHLRFFTRKSFRKLLDRVGLEFISMERISYENTKSWASKAPQRNHFLKTMSSFCKENGMPYNEYDFRTFQYVFVAEKR